MKSYFKKLVFTSLLIFPPAGVVYAHHSFAMYDTNKTYNFTGVVTRVNPNSAHLIMYMVPLNEARESIIRDEDGKPIEWAIEMGSSASEALEGITVNGFPRGSIISVGLHPLRNGRPAGGRGESGLFKCPQNTPPTPGMHCDSVEGATSHGEGLMPEATDPSPGI